MSTTTDDRTTYTRRPRGPSTGPRKHEWISAVEVSHKVLLKTGSAWETVPAAARCLLLDQAHEMEALLSRRTPQNWRKERLTQRLRRALIRHAGVDLNALGAQGQREGM